MKRIIVFLTMLSCFVLAFAGAKHRYTLVIDAGHGGKDAGACAFGAKEKTINLNVALAFGRYVERYCSDVRVIYTRKTDVFVPLHERAAIANRNKADVFISIHTNAVASKRPIVGMETYTMGMRRSDEKLSAAMRENEVVLIEKDYRQHYAGYDPRSPESMMVFQIMNEQNMAKSVELASLIQRYTCATAKRQNKGVRQDAFLVLRETSMPACLVELGYITTRSDMNYLTNARNVDLMGKGIYQAFAAFKNGQQRSASIPVEEPVAEEKPAVVEELVVVEKPVVVEEPAVVKIPEVVKEPAVVEKPVVAEEPQKSKPMVNSSQQSAIVFKVQLFASKSLIKKGDARFRGLTDVDHYQEGGLWKYTVGSSENYDDINQLRRKVSAKFPQAFIIAFKGDEKIDVNKARHRVK